MRYLTSALLSEGPSDDRFLPRLLERGLNSLCATRFEDTVEVADVTVLRHRSGPATIDQMIGLVNRNPRSFAIVFVHRDQRSWDTDLPTPHRRQPSPIVNSRGC
jgi:hypothetical protein